MKIECESSMVYNMIARIRQCHGTFSVMDVLFLGICVVSIASPVWVFAMMVTRGFSALECDALICTYDEIGWYYTLTHDNYTDSCEHLITSVDIRQRGASVVCYVNGDCLSLRCNSPWRWALGTILIILFSINVVACIAHIVARCDHKTPAPVHETEVELDDDTMPNTDSTSTVDIERTSLSV